MKKLIKSSAIAVMTCFVASSALAERPHRRGHKKKHAAFMNPKMLEKFADKINLDEATLEAIKDKIYQGKKAAIDWKSALESKKLDLHRELDSKNPSRSRVMNLIDETGALRTKLKKHRIGLMLEIRSMLTPEQIKKVKRLRREFKSKHWRRKGDRKHRAGPRYLDRDEKRGDRNRE